MKPNLKTNILRFWVFKTAFIVFIVSNNCRGGLFFFNEFKNFKKNGRLLFIFFEQSLFGLEA